MLIAFVFMSILLALSAVLVSYITLYVKAERQSVNDVAALALAEAGIDKAIYELNQNPGYTGESDTVLDNGTFKTAVATIDGNTRRVTSTGYVPNSVNPVATRIVKATASINTSVVSFQFGIQAGDGGIEMLNTASVRGNVYSTGPVEGENRNVIRGDAISAGPAGRIDNVHATSSGYAHRIEDSILDKDAYYQSIANTIVGGTSYPGSPDQATTSLPISDAQIEEWKTAAASGGTHTSPCPYVIKASLSLGPRKINCDLTIQGTPTITLTGPLWVNGDITIQNSVTIRVDPSLGGTSVAVVADKESDRLNSGTIELQNSMEVEGSGTQGSYVLFISQNNSAESGGRNTAIDVKNSASGALLLYAGHGEIVLQNNISIKEVSAWRIELKNSAEVVYETGLTNARFSSGPGGSWTVTPGSYVIAK